MPKGRKSGHRGAGGGEEAQQVLAGREGRGGAAADGEDGVLQGVEATGYPGHLLVIRPLAYRLLIDCCEK